ncbi:uncharacterized protein EDB91DRAFT_1084834 [Suillus paluster]|uniref:uncharacterized protein n=1 Tax=Suillus paluster TaxID=48578 RepID=UPI001B8810E8|nr:uncharacterized protein EDB91DRAFT_1084834 [Suillus paluster]KAG1732239.1 hypothetical protein EDB91DRAFT_1084834 [Suillus paluster]
MMKEKEPTSLKAISQATHPYPTTPHPPSQSSKSGPKNFPPNILQEDDLDNSATPANSLANSIHTPSNPTIDQKMNDLPNPTVNHTPTSKEQAILVHLALADMNRSVLSQNGTNHSTTLPQFTPASNGDFPKVHMLHSAQIFNHLENKVLLTWFQVEHPKFMIRVFDHSGKDVAE